MAFRFRLDETVEKGFRRIVQEQLERAEERLSSTGEAPETVHEVRKSLKRVRALMRLVRSGLDEQIFKSENARLRDAGRKLSGARDRHVMLETLKDLETAHGLDAGTAEQIRAVIAGTSANGSGAEPPDPAAIAEAARMIGQARRALKRSPLAGEGLAIVETGLETGLRRCRKAFRAAYVAGSDDAFHEWRKTLQHHWRHMNVLNAAWPDLMAARAAVARDLSQLIGTDHDYGVLADFALAEPAVERRHARDLDRLCRFRQRAIRLMAEPLGERLLAEGADGLARRATLYWTTAQRIATATPPTPGLRPETRSKGRPAPISPRGRRVRKSTGRSPAAA